MTTLDVLYLGDEPATVRALVDVDDCTVCLVSTPTTALDRLRDAAFDCILCEYPLADADSFLRRVHEQGGPPVVVRTADGTRPDAPHDRLVGPGGVDDTDDADGVGAGATDPADGAGTDDGTGDGVEGRDAEPARVLDTLRAYAGRRPVPAADGSHAASVRTGEPTRVPAPDATPEPFDDPLLDSLGDFLFVTDAEANLIRWNAAFTEGTGYDTDEIAEMEPLDFFPDRDAEAVTAALARVAEDGEATEELNILTKGGEEVPYEISATLVGEEAPVLCGVGRDITKRRETQRKLDEAIDELERSNAELEQFAYVASHDMKQPLRMVSSYLDLLERRYADELDEDAEEFIGFAKDGAERMREMIDGLLAYSRVGRRDREHEPVDLRDALDTALTNLEIAIEESEAEITVDPLPRVLGDPGQLAQLFQNLVGNAIKYSEGTPHVEVRAEDAGDHWAVAVADEGSGIPPERLDRVFDIFAHDEESGGSGIGLAICEKIVDRHGGDIRVESEVGVGSTFTFTFPKLGADSPEPEPSGAEAEAGNGAGDRV
ncbi:ATP-binding protein [Halobium salinum]|uniref:histidine kinase n=1 Tax=Halobium salinum TaxID=1364940 RepID=A0ABD5PAJ7_9EURY|nr:ATP-binding protein [Halobium salinum]